MRRPSEFSPVELQRFWQAKLRRLPDVISHVEQQVIVFSWPDLELMMGQYKDLMPAWSRLSEVDDVAKRVSLAPSQGHFDWVRWWKLSHTDSRFLPSGCEAAFALYHFMGMLGVSEARVESIASLLKRYRGAGPSSADRIVENHCVNLWS